MNSCWPTPDKAYPAMTGLADACVVTVRDEQSESRERYQAFLSVLDRYARDSLAAIQLVLAQPAISSQLIDNLNASIHLRALLTDLFLVGEIVRAKSSAVTTALGE